MKLQLIKYSLLLHRRLGLILGVFVLFWAMTGMLHPIMTATQPQAVQRMPPLQQLDLRHAIPAPEVLRAQQITTFHELQTIQLHPQQFAYRVLKPHQNIADYYDVKTGLPIEGAEPYVAKQLAMWYTGLKAQNIISTRLITKFSDDYPSVNRLLPVWQVQFDNGLRAYVEPSQSRLATLSNDRKMWLSRIFRLGHTWTWNDHVFSVPSILMKLVLIGVLVLIVMGIRLFFTVKRRQTRSSKLNFSRVVHRYLAIVLSVFLLLWVSSGFYHIWQKKTDIQTIPSIFYTQNLSLSAWHEATKQPIQRLNLVPSAISNKQSIAAWFIVPLTKSSGLQGAMTAEHDHNSTHQHVDIPVILRDAISGEKLNLLAQMRQLAANYLNQPLHDVDEGRWITQFEGEYGFINKRLPVVKVQTHADDQLRLYIEPSTGAIAASINQADALEGWSFAYLHKWAGLPLSREIRDILLGITAGMITLIVIFGFLSARRKL